MTTGKRRQPMALRRFARQPMALRRFARQPMALRRFARQPMALRRFARQPMALRRFARQPMALRRFARQPMALRRFARQPMALRRFARQPMALRRFAYLVVAVLSVYAIVLLGLYLDQENMLFRGERIADDFKFSGSSHEEFFQVNGHRVSSLLYEYPGSQQIILYLHGNTGNLETLTESAQTLVKETSKSVWILDYPGYGKSEGQISNEDELFEVAEVFMSAAIKKAGGAQNIILYGRSLGTGLAAKLASEYPVSGLILVTPYYSMQTLINWKMPWVPDFVLKYKIRSDLFIPKVNCPIVVLHGNKDTVIPFDEGQRLAALSKLSSFFIIPNTDHRSLTQAPEFWIAVRSFVSKLTSTSKGA